MARVADQEMLAALRVVTVERGVDPRGYSLVAFGGAGPMHAARIADQLDVTRVLCPRPAGVLSALGLIASDRRRDFAKSVFLSGSNLTAEAISGAVEELAQAARRELPTGRIEVACDVRYRGQAFELEIAAPPRADPKALRARFEEAHRERYGYSDPEGELELVNVRLAAVADGVKPELAAQGGARPARPSLGTRLARFGRERLETTVWRGELQPGEEVEGPAVCELPESTVVVPPGWSGQVGTEGTLVLGRR
jgi:N-methylhydantoinase A